MTEAEEFDNWSGLDQSYKNMMDEVDKNTPRCHMRPMFLDGGDGEMGTGDAWFECSYCGHTKDI